MKRTWYKQGEELLREIRNTHVGMRAVEPTGVIGSGRPGENASEIAFWYLGQCGFAMKCGNKVIYIDPVLNDLCDADGTRRYYPWPFEPDQVRADYLLCTHNHLDHLAPETVVKMTGANPKMKIVVPKGCTGFVKELGVPEHQILGINAGEILQLEDMKILAIQAAHPVHEKDEQGNDLALSYYLVLNGIHMLHTGDTYLTDQLLKAYRRLPAPDLLFVPINGGDYFRTARNCIGNLNPLEAARLAAILHADMAIPMHFDMVMENTQDPFIFPKLLWEENPCAKFHIPALGERVIYRK